MSWIGLLMFFGGGAGVAFSTWSIFHRKRPTDVLFAVLAPVGMLTAITGLLLVFVPGFFG